jgi:hypothetical protein
LGQVGKQAADGIDVFDVHGGRSDVVADSDMRPSGNPGSGFALAGPVCQKRVRRRAPNRGQSAYQMLTFLTLAQLLLYIPLLALLGQGLLFVLAGPKRDTNLFYQLLALISKPFTLLVRKLTPAKVLDHHVPIVTFFLLVIVYAIVTFERIDLCVRIGVELCK